MVYFGVVWIFPAFLSLSSCVDLTVSSTLLGIYKKNSEIKCFVIIPVLVRNKSPWLCVLKHHRLAESNKPRMPISAIRAQKQDTQPKFSGQMMSCHFVVVLLNCKLTGMKASAKLINVMQRLQVDTHNCLISCSYEQKWRNI